MSIPQTQLGKIGLSTRISISLPFTMLDWDAHLGKMLCMERLVDIHNIKSKISHQRGMHNSLPVSVLVTDYS